MSAYNNIDEAYENATDTISSIADGNEWTDEQYGQAISDAGKAYDETGGTLNLFLNSFSLDTLWGADADQVSTEAFWDKLYSLAKSNWKSFPNYNDCISWLASASNAAVSATASMEVASTQTIIKDTAVESAQDIRDVGGTIGNVASSPATWYGIAAAAILGLVVYLGA